MSDYISTISTAEASAHRAGRGENWDLAPAEAGEALDSAVNHGGEGESLEDERPWQNVEEYAPEHWSERCY